MPYIQLRHQNTHIQEHTNNAYTCNTQVQPKLKTLPKIQHKVLFSSNLLLIISSIADSLESS
eukprot:m.72097 g.72097  ORF g.72097 m.72097 type:complete len:62 (+) comp24426_c0_seq4:88-273(+)